MTWEIVVGLEVHVQLATRSKMFCGCAVTFGAPPNTHVCPVCLGLPGALPVPNAQAVKLGTQAALALGSTIHETSVFARKNYFYPDLPKGYQISQFDKPLATGGAVHFDSPERGRIAVSITRLHLEEDAGKSLHDRIPGQTAVDLNRAGAPLAEIVSGPDMRSPAEARAYLTALKQILVYAGVSECSMEKGSLRVDANMSIRRHGETRLGVKTEVKNMNSFANVERALEVEYQRQVELLDAGGKVEQVSLLFNATSGTVKVMRSKEESHDYRYFPDPDLPPLVVTPTWIAEQQAALPELPDALRERLRTQYAVSEYHAGQLALDRAVADYFESVVKAGAEPAKAVGWVLGDAMTGFSEGRGFGVSADRLASLIALVKEGVVSQQAAKKVYEEMEKNGDGPKAIAERLGLVQVGDTDSLAKWVDEVLTTSAGEVARYKGGEVKLIGFFVGQVMKKSGGKADPKKVQPMLIDRLRE
jgi:aspartyl-tRNA(Asn)/glutamyl-tRNA(Gln) amidotransferase subunit B